LANPNLKGSQLCHDYNQIIKKRLAGIQIRWPSRRVNPSAFFNPCPTASLKSVQSRVNEFYPDEDPEDVDDLDLSGIEIKKFGGEISKQLGK
jgi:hypothetical protein